MKDIIKYPNLENRFIIEASYGCYTESGWCYITHKRMIIHALEFITRLKYPEQYRIVDYTGEVVF